MASINSIHFQDTYDMPLRHPVTDEVLMTDDNQEMFIRLGNPAAIPSSRSSRPAIAMSSCAAKAK